MIIKCQYLKYGTSVRKPAYAVFTKCKIILVCHSRDFIEKHCGKIKTVAICFQIGSKIA